MRARLMADGYRRWSKPSAIAISHPAFSHPRALANDDARGSAPEVEAARVEIDGRRRAVVLERAQIAKVAAQPEVIVEESHHADSRVPAKVVGRRADRE